MPFFIVNEPERVFLKAEGAITVRQAHDLAAGLSDCLRDGATVAVDTAGVDDVDTAVLQLFCSLRKAAHGLSFENPSDAFLRAVDRCGLRHELLGSREVS